ncbi:MAG: glycosyltransferase family 9 protein [Candidatus Aminicenantes bacterium]|nr:glycosyltransferase family 9 protein [Candidatus Aminicenantes bacterium]
MNQRDRQKIDLSAVKKILLIRLRRIGDIVMTTPAVTVLKEKCPDISLTYLLEEPYRELVEGNPHLDNVFVIPKKQSTKEFHDLIHEIRREQFDVLIDFHGGPRASWLTLFSKAKLKIGYKIKNKSFLYDIKIPRSPEKGQIHSVENHINMVEALGINVDSIPPLLIPDAVKEEKETIVKFIQENGLEDSKILVLHIGAGNRFRDWGTDNILALTDLFSKNPEVKIILIGAPEDKERAEEIISKSNSKIVSAVGKLGLRELKELIAYASLFIGPDSGPMHIAATTDTPLVIYFGPTLPAHFSPWKANATLIEKDYDCRHTCRQRECIFEDFRCLQSITPQEVYIASMDILK